MLFESRSIIFSDEELAEAMQPIFEERGMDNVTQIFPCHDAAGEVMISIKELNEEETYITSAELAPIILKHCLDKKVPLPRNSSKELALRGDLLALIVHLENGKH
jgi:hypothetical protein